MERTIDPIRDAENYYNECEHEYQESVKCDKCGEVITDAEFMFYRNCEPVTLCAKCYGKIIANIL